MRKEILSSLKLLTHRQKRHYFYVLFFCICSSMAEFVGVGSIVPLITIMANPDFVLENEFVQPIYRLFDQPPVDSFIIYITFCVIGLVFLSNMISVGSIFVTQRYLHRLSAELSGELYNYFLARDFSKLKSEHSSILITKIVHFCPKFAEGMIVSSILLQTRVFLILAILFVLMLVDPKITLAAFVFILTAYLVIFLLVKETVIQLGRKTNQFRTLLNKKMVESFSGEKIIRLYNISSDISNAFRVEQKKLAKSSANVAIISSAPFYIMEMISVSGVVLISVYLFNESGDFSEHIGILTLFGIAAYRLLPACQRAYHDLGKISNTIPVYEELKNDVASAIELGKDRFSEESNIRFDFSRGVELSDVSFSYEDKPIFNSISLKFALNGVIVLGGDSGVGKSTLLELIMGLYKVDKGIVKAGGHELSESIVKQWQNQISYVPQTSYLLDESIAYNIALSNNVDEEKLNEVIQISGLKPVIDELKLGVESLLGENAESLSGGQRQRVGLARALYRDSSILILDEAMNSLELVSAVKIMENIISRHHYKAIIVVTHRKKEIAVDHQFINLSEYMC